VTSTTKPTTTPGDTEPREPGIVRNATAAAAKTVVVPLVARAAATAARYVATNGPDFVQRTLLPKVQGSRLVASLLERLDRPRQDEDEDEDEDEREKEGTARETKPADEASVREEERRERAESRKARRTEAQS